MEPIQLILASNSPRRRQLMALGGWHYRLRPAEVDESPEHHEAPRSYVLRMATSKACSGASAKKQPGELVIGSDTIVVDLESATSGNTPNEQTRGVILGKPANAQDAARMLKRLCGRTHQVITAVAVYRPFDGRVITDMCVTEVKMRSYTSDEIQSYIASGDPLDKAGAYAIQHTGFDPVESIQGCFANVVGLPLCTLNRILAGFGLEPPLKISQDCDHESCPFCQEVMRGGF